MQFDVKKSYIFLHIPFFYSTLASVFEPYYILIMSYFCPVPNFSLFLFYSACSFFASKREQPSHLACIFFIYLVSFLLPFCLKKDTTPVSFALFSGRTFTIILICIHKATTSFDIVAYKKG